jgi:glycosyltransferase involved in cell wall biosynthesis
MTNRIKVLVYPSKSNINSYLLRSLKIFGSKGDITFFDFRGFFRFKKIWNRAAYQSDLAVINWLENLLVDNQTGRFSIKGFIRYIVYFALIKIFCKEQVYIRHNFYPHSCKTKMCKKVTKVIVNVFEMMATHKASHSELLVEKNYLYIPHPFYDGGDIDGDVSLINKPYYLIFGVIARYKSIEHVIENWSFEENLYVVGMCRDNEYLQELKGIAEGRNVIFDVRYVSESEAASIVHHAEAVILPHDGSEMIVSGAYYFAISFKTPVIVLENKLYNFLVEKYGYKHIVRLKSFSEITTLTSEQSITAAKEFAKIKENHQVDWLSHLKTTGKT